MFRFGKPATMVTAERGPAGPRRRRCRVPAAPRGARHAARAAVPRRASSRLIVGMGCFWGAERVFWQAPGRLHDRRRLRGRLHAEPDLRGGLLRPDRATPRSSSSSSTRRRRATRRSCASSGRTTTRRRACARATTSARSTARRSTGRARRSARRPRRRARCYAAGAHARGLRRDHDGDRRGRAVLLRRGLPPAVPREEPERLLRPRRHRRQLPGRGAGLSFRNRCA